MKGSLILAFFAASFFVIAAPIYMKDDTQALTIHGRRFVNAQFVNGQWAVPLQDLSRAFGGGGVTLEPVFDLDGSKLSALLPALSPDHKHKIDMSSNTFFVRKAGEVSSRVFMFEGQEWVPAADVARAFGTTFTTPATGRPTLNLIGGPGGIFGVRQ